MLCYLSMIRPHGRHGALHLPSVRDLALLHDARKAQSSYQFDLDLGLP